MYRRQRVNGVEVETVGALADALGMEPASPATADLSPPVRC